MVEGGIEGDGIGMAHAETTPVGSAIHSEKFEPAVFEAHRQVPEKAEDIARLLELIDGQSLANFSQYEAPGDRETLFPVTRISINELFNDFTGAGNTEAKPTDDDKVDRQTYVLFGPLVVYPYGHPLTGQDIVYDRAIGLMSRIANAKREGKLLPQVDLHVLGYPHAMWGKTSEKWADELKQTGFSAYGNVFTEYLRDKVLNEKPDRVVFQGMSFGAPIAINVLNHLSDAERKNIEFLQDNPAGLHKRKLKGMQIIAGIGTDFGIQKLYDMLHGAPTADSKKFYKEAEAYLAKRGIDSFDDPINKKLKKQAMWEGIKIIVDGSRESVPDSVRSFIRRATTDPTTFSPVRLLETIGVGLKNSTPLPFIKRGERITEVPIKSTHGGFYDRVKKWGRVIDLVKNEKNSSNYTSIDELTPQP